MSAAERWGWLNEATQKIILGVSRDKNPKRLWDRSGTPVTPAHAEPPYHRRDNTVERRPSKWTEFFLKIFGWQWQTASFLRFAGAGCYVARALSSLLPPMRAVTRIRGGNHLMRHRLGNLASQVPCSRKGVT